MALEFDQRSAHGQHHQEDCVHVCYQHERCLRHRAIERVCNLLFPREMAKSDLTSMYRPAGFDGDAVLSVVRQYWYDSYGNIRYAAPSLSDWLM